MWRKRNRIGDSDHLAVVLLLFQQNATGLIYHGVKKNQFNLI